MLLLIREFTPEEWKSVKVRLAAVSDIPAMIDLERQCATAAHWSEEQYRRLFDSGEGSSSRRLALVIDGSGEVPAQPDSQTQSRLLGFLVATHLPPEWELENIVVAPAARRKGLATRLFEEFLARAEAKSNEAKSDSVFLEVRESNQAARSLYEHWAFEETGRRKGYYASDAEDAILYRRSLP